MNDATCKTCPWWAANYRPGEIGDCRLHGPHADDGGGIWPVTRDLDWCGSHPDRQPHLECASTTILTHETVPTESDMRRLIDALEKMASRAQRATP